MTKRDGCKGCKYESESEHSEYCTGCTQNAVDKYVRKTNADRIRSMGDEELAMVIMCPYDTAGDDEDIMPCMKIPFEDAPDSKTCMECTIAWLKREVKDA